MLTSDGSLTAATRRQVARQMWTLFEPIHAVTYFSAESRDAAARAGYRGFWMGYVAMRIAPLGPVGPAVATAVCYGFHPSRLERALPDAWSFAGPDRALAARLTGVDAALRRVGKEAAASLTSPELSDAADLLWSIAQRAEVAGRVLAAANQALPPPAEAHLRLWQAATTLREHRGDGHNAVLIAAGVSPTEAHALKVAAAETDPAVLRESRRWEAADWEAAAEKLRSRGWLDAAGRLTEQGRSAHERIEDSTDDAAAQPWDHLSADELSWLAGVMGPLAHAAMAGGAYPVPNPIGAPAPDGTPFR